MDSVYSAICGGHSEDNDIVWGGVPDPSLRGRPDLIGPVNGFPTPKSLDAFLAADLPAILRFDEEVGGMDWPIGYGANPTLDVLGVGAFPTLIVFGADGRAVWSGWDVDELPDALDQALAIAGRGVKDEGRD